MTAGRELEFRRLFTVEAAGHLDRLAAAVAGLERAPDDVVAALVSEARDLKSSAALVGLGRVAEVADALADLLGGLRTRHRKVAPEFVDAIRDVVDALRGLVAAGVTGPEEPAHRAKALEGLARAVAAAPPASGPPAARSAADVRFAELFRDEAGPTLDRLSGTAVALERRGAEPELVAELLRGAHKLKGSAAVVGWDEASRLVHRLEDRLGELHAGTRAASPTLVACLPAVLDAIRVATPAFVAGEDAAPALASGWAALRGLDEQR